MNFFSRIFYSSSGNKKIIQKNIDLFFELIKYNNDIYVKVILAFKTAHLNIIAGMIAFIGFINKDGIKDNYNFKIGIIFLMIFIGLSIFTILISHYYDTFTIKSTTNYLGEYAKLSKKYKKEAESKKLDKEKAEEMNKLLGEFNSPKYPIFGFIINILYLITWGFLLLGLYNIIFYYISIL